MAAPHSRFNLRQRNTFVYSFISEFQSSKSGVLKESRRSMYNTINLVIFLVKLVVVILTFSFAIFRVEAAFHPLARTAASYRHRNSLIKSYPTPLRPRYKMTVTSSTSTSNNDSANEYAPAQVVADETGNKWRLCAGVAVLNSRNQLLVGERKGKPGNWQCPQGGVDDAWTPQQNSSSAPKPKETIVEAATRELYEETGLAVGTNGHAMLDSSFPTPGVSSNTGIRYFTAGSSNWLTRAGFSGQELHWVFFRCTDGRGDQDPSMMCDITGKGGESAEFTQVQWKDVNEVVEGMWEGKRAPYDALQSLLGTYGAMWQEQIESLDFSGKWSRDFSFCIGVVEGLQARGLTKEHALNEAKKPYIQLWERNGENTASWDVTTYNDDGETPRRRLEYKTGTWEETYEGKSTLFGDSHNNEPVTLKRHTSYVGEEDAHPVPIAQVTITTGPKGIEESRRYLKNNQMFLRRTFWPSGEESSDSCAVSTEVFTR